VRSSTWTCFSRGTTFIFCKCISI